jgi:hypothetical protein
VRPTAVYGIEHVLSHKKSPLKRGLFLCAAHLNGAQHTIVFADYLAGAGSAAGAGAASGASAGAGAASGAGAGAGATSGAGAGAGAGVTSGAGAAISGAGVAGAVASSFLPQPTKAAAAIRVASTREFFISVSY